MRKKSSLKAHRQTNFFADRWFALPLVCITAGWWFNIARLEWALILLIICLIFALEAMNTAIESVVDLVSPEYHPLAKIAKDTAAAALIFAVFASLIIATLVFVPHF